MMTEINLNELERLAKGITPGPWSVKDDWHFYILDATGKREIAKISNKYRSKDVNAAYIAAACNAVPELIKMYREADDEAADANSAWQKVRRENLALQERVQELERQNAALEDRIRYLIEERDGLEWAIGFSSSKEYCE